MLKLIVVAVVGVVIGFLIGVLWSLYKYAKVILQLNDNLKKLEAEGKELAEQGKELEEKVNGRSDS